MSGRAIGLTFSYSRYTPALSALARCYASKCMLDSSILSTRSLSGLDSVSSTHGRQHACIVANNDIGEHRGVAEAARGHTCARGCLGGNRDGQSPDGLRVPRGRRTGEDSERIRRKGCRGWKREMLRLHKPRHITNSQSSRLL